MSKWGDRIKHVCLQCNKEQLLRPAVAKVKKYCGNQCRNKAHSEKTRIIRKIKCEHCGKRFEHKFRNGNRGLRFCSYSCAAKVRARGSAPLAMLFAAEIRIKNAVRMCAICGNRYEGRTDSKYCSDTCSRLAGIKLDDRKSPRTFECKECQDTVTVSYGNKLRTFCSPTCRERYARRKQSEYERKRKRKQERIRQARIIKQSIENVDPIRVFERDGWVCRFCGVETPREKRKSFEHNAPELDHIIPISLCGEHSYQNTQCLCRHCNSIKSNHPIHCIDGELKFINESYT